MLQTSQLAKLPSSGFYKCSVPKGNKCDTELNFKNDVSKTIFFDRNSVFKIFP